MGSEDSSTALVDSMILLCFCFASDPRSDVVAGRVDDDDDKATGVVTGLCEGKAAIGIDDFRRQPPVMLSSMLLVQPNAIGGTIQSSTHDAFFLDGTHWAYTGRPPPDDRARSDETYKIKEVFCPPPFRTLSCWVSRFLRSLLKRTRLPEWWSPTRRTARTPTQAARRATAWKPTSG